MSEIDLPPHEWKSERSKRYEPLVDPPRVQPPRQPFFGTGAPQALAWLIGFTILQAAIYFALGK